MARFVGLLGAPTAKSGRPVRWRVGCSAHGRSPRLLDGYVEQAKSFSTDSEITLSLTDLYALDDLEAAVTGLAGDMGKGDVAGRGPAIGSSLMATVEYGASPMYAFSQYDIGGFSSALSAADKGFSQRDGAVKAALAKAVVAQWAGAYREGSTGLSIYFPPYKGGYAPSYDNLSDLVPGLPGWRTFLKAYYAAGEGASGAKLSGALTSSTGADGKVTASGVVDGATKATVVEARLSHGLDTGGDRLLLGDDAAVIDQQSGEVKGTWDGKVLLITQGQSKIVAYASRREQGGITTLKVPLAYGPKSDQIGRDIVMVVRFDEAQKELSRAFVQYAYNLEMNLVASPLAPPVGSAAMGLARRRAAGDTAYEWKHDNGGTFDPGSAFELSWVPLASLLDPGGGDVAIVELSVTDYAGNSAEGSLLF